MNRKKLSLISILLVLSMTFLACNNSNGGENQNQDENGNQSTGITEKIELSLGHGQALESPPHKALVAFSDIVKEKSDGMIEIQIFPANQLGNERDLAEGLEMGTIDMAYISSGVMENFQPKLGVYSLPFIFRDIDHVEKIVNGSIGEELYAPMLEDQGIRVMKAFVQGFRYLYSNTPMPKLEDFAGVKIRVPESPAFVGTWNSLGANPTPMPWGELYTSMQTGVVDAFEVHTYSVVVEHLYEVIKHMTTTGHILSTSLVMVSEDVFSTLPQEAQDIINEAIEEAWAVNYDLIVNGNEKNIETLRNEKGVEVHEVSQEERAEMRQAAQSLYDEYAQNLDAGDLINTIENTN
ncbi:TRAP transporter substrate-binding protein [Alkalibacter saccharofermentans]|uniref:Tripartite ATP-independent transporter solute receptor, DctP family n=1 Tax=Alkalibacter saccharofermentans DSM 14828 TaxID=1120975 RepID=A0A1M5A6R0_9FIRM|nr:TRAP transporter substrate-binding protein [Alkalibacter saccharofermentans]SHF25835.1 tripartite ATP-independent transporter solute receptor, DctP family [Alkalibacter saccharofermentans DSM 14828]